MISKFKKKPVVIEAIRWSGKEEDLQEILNWVDFEKLPDIGYVEPGMGYVPALGTLDVPTPNGMTTANPGDYICKDVEGNVYPCKASVFEATYEKTWE